MSPEIDRSVSFDIPRENARITLNEFAKQAQVQMLFDFDIVQNIETNDVRGNYPVWVALQQLIESTGLNAVYIDENIYSVVPAINENGEIPKMQNRKNLFTAIIGIFAAGAVSEGTAQTDNVPSISNGVLEEIVVTARKRDESLLDVPVAISVLTETGIQAAGIDELGDILDNTVGMVYNERDGTRSQAFPGVRGIKNFTGGGVERVSTFVDSMPIAGSQATIQFVDVVGVEVYRGPQSAVFGRSVFAGAINYSLRQPSLDEIEGGVNAQLGQDGRSALSGYFSAPIIEDTLGIYLSASTDEYDGPGSVVSSDGYKMGSRDTEYYSAAISFQPTDNLSMTLRYSDVSIDDGPAPDYNLDPATDSNYVLSPTAGTSPLYTGELNFQDEPALNRNFCPSDENCVLDPGWEMERERLAFDLDYDFDNGHSLTFRAFTSEDVAFDVDDQDNTAFTTGFVVNMGTDTTIDEDYYEVVWTSPDDAKLRYTLGYSQYEYFRDNVAWFVHPSSDLVDGDGATPSVGTQQINNSGFFAGLFYDINDQLTVSLEGRQQEDEIIANDPDPTDSNVPSSVSDTFLPRIALNYAASETLSLYAQYAEGVQPATVNSGAVESLQRATAAALAEITVDGQTFDSAIPFLDDILAVDEEVLKSYEIGLKGQFLDGRLNLGAALFKIETDGYAEVGNLFYFPDGVDSADVLAAIQQYGIDTGNTLLSGGLSETALRVRGSVNIGDLNSQGMELDGTYLINENWQVAAQLTYLDTEFGDGCTPIGENFGLPQTELVLASGGTLSCTDISGNAFLFTPEIQFGASVTYETQLNNGWDLFTRVDMRYEDEQYMDWFEAGWLPSSTKFNLRAGINTDTFRVEAYAQNVFDDRTPPGAQYEPARNEIAEFTGNRGPVNNYGLNVAIAPPRELGVKLSYIF